MKRFLPFRRLLLSGWLFALPHLAPAQEQADSIDTLQKFAPSVFIDCRFCDEAHIRREITFVNYVRDRLQADVHVLITTQRTGSGGQEYTLTFIGQNKALGMNDTLIFATKQSDTQDMIRTTLISNLKIGFARYVAKTPLAEYLSVTYKRPTKAAQVVDRWDYWVFSISFNSFINGEKLQDYLSLWGSLSARRITEEWKISFSFSANYNENNYSFETVDAKGQKGKMTISSFSRSQSFSGLITKSHTDHWSYGAFGSAYASTYSNISFSWTLAPAIEYDVFPYSESTRKILRILYRINYSSTSYLEETIFEKTSERLWSQSLSFSLSVKQPWGSVGGALEGSHYLHDFDKKRLRVSGNLSLRLFEGFSLNFFGSYSRINDQLSLRKGTASQEEVLLRRTQLATSYSYYASIGLSYTFGSIYNNIVNPRFGDSGGGGVTIYYE